MIGVSGVVKSYGRTQVLRGISCEVGEGHTVILGASGSGKSTFLSVLSGLETPDEGRVVCCGEEISRMNERERTQFRKAHVGFVFQQYYLLPHLTVRQNVRMGAALVGNGEFDGLIDALGLAPLSHKRPSELSGGEQQRVCIARALAKRPQVLFLDEPTGALDEDTGRKVLDLLLRLQREWQFAMITVTHNANIAETADCVFRLASGKLVGVQKNERPRSAFEIGW